MKMDVKNRESFKEMMCKVANKHGCSIVFEPGFHWVAGSDPSIDSMGMTIVKGTHIRYFYIFWPSVENQTQAATSIWASFFDTYYEQRKSDKFWTKENPNLYISTDCNSEKSLADERIKNIYKRMINSLAGIKLYDYQLDAIDRMYGANPYYRPEIKNVIFNDPATIVFWTDGTKTVVKHRNLYKYDDSKPVTIDCEKSYINDRKYELIYETRADAEKVLNGMSEIIDEYGFVTVADLYDISGLPGAYYTDSKIGWKGSIKESIIKRVRDGYVIDLPKPEVLE